MIDLARLQTDFAHVVRGGDASAMLQDAVVGAGLSAKARLAVHQNNHRLSLLGVLTGMFPVTAQLVGEEFFAMAARAFIKAHPPIGAALIDYGHDLPAFLLTHESLQDMKWIADVAAIEAGRSAVYHEADETPLDPSSLSGLEPQAVAALGLTPVAAARLIRSSWPVHLVWDAHQPGAAIHLEQIDLDGGPVALLILRRDFEIFHIPLGDRAAALFDLFLAGASIGEAMERTEDDGTGLGLLLTNLTFTEI